MRSIVVIAFIVTLLGCSTSPSPILPPKQLEAVQNAFVINRTWTTSIGDGASDKYLRLKPVLADGILYSVDHLGTVRAFDVKRRDVIWEAVFNTPAGSGITLHGEQLYFGTSKGQLIALARETGKEIWRSQLSSEVLATPAVAKGLVVVRCVNGALYGLNQADGSKAWMTQEITPSLTLRGTSQPVVVGDLILSAYDNGYLLAQNLQTGNVIWRATIATPNGRNALERLVDIDATPVVIDDVVYTVAFQGKLAALQLGSGQVLWARDIDSYIDIAVDAYRIYMIDSDGLLWAMDRSNGATLWKQDALLRRGLTAPILHDSYVIVGDFNGYLHWMSRDSGKLVARVHLDDDQYTSPSLDESEDLLFPKSSDLLVQPIIDGDMLIAMNRYGYTEAFDITYP